jgi:hypothetical protein
LAHWHIGFNRKARKEGAERKVKQYPFSNYYCPIKKLNKKKLPV